MYSLELLIGIGIGAAIIGIAVGFFIGRKSPTSQREQEQLQTQLAELKQQQEDYQDEVSDHFLETAQLFNQLTNSYKDVHTHLAAGAQKLAGDRATESLKALSDESTDVTGLIDNNDISTVIENDSDLDDTAAPASNDVDEDVSDQTENATGKPHEN